MARHRSRAWRLSRSEAFLPWVPMLVGVAIMAGYVIYAVTLRAGDRPLAEDDTHFVVPSPPPATTAAPEDPAPTSVVGPAGDYQRRAHPPPASPAPPEPEPTRDPTPDPPPADVTGEYDLADSFRRAFVGKVTIVNRSHREQDWVVELAFPSNVGQLKAFRVDDGPQPTLRVVEDRYVFASTVEGRSEVVLAVNFERSGEDVLPTICEVNGTECT